MILSNTRERTRFFRFAAVGAFGAVIDFGVFNLLTIPLQFSSILASTISFLAAVASNFTGNRYWTYPDSRSKPLAQQMGQFLIISVLGLGIRVGMFATLEGWLIRFSELVLPPASLSPIVAGHNLTLALAILVVMLWNFLLIVFGLTATSTDRNSIWLIYHNTRELTATPKRPTRIQAPGKRPRFVRCAN